MLTDEQITKAAFKYHELTGAHHSTFHSGATWANDQNAARIAELEAQKEELIEALNKLLEASKSAARQTNYLLGVYRQFYQI